MKVSLRTLPLLVMTASFSAVDFPGTAHATTDQYWNFNGTGGSDIWSVGPANKNWNIIAGAAGNTAWSDPSEDVAVFQDATGGSVTVVDTVQAAGIIQNGVNYSINAGILTLVPDSASNNPFIKVLTGSLTIESILDGANGLIKSGTGNLLLSNTSDTNTYTGTTSVMAGTLTLGGSLTSATVDIALGAVLLDQAGGLASSTVLTNAGMLTMNASDTIGTLDSNGTIAGTGVLTATTYNLNDGTSVTGHLGLGTLNSNGAVGITGTAGALAVNVQTGTLTLGGNNLADTAVVTLSGGATLSLSGADTIGTLNSNGIIAGTGVLTATTYNLNDGTSVTGHLGLGTLNSNGAVGITGTADALAVNVQTGTLTNTGTLGTATTHLDIAGGATLIASGTQHYELLTTSGTEAGTWKGNLNNNTTIAPGGAGGFGTLQVNGDFTNSPGGILKLDIASANHDVLGVTGTAGFDGTLELNQVGTADIAPFVPINVVDAGSYSGNFTTFSENLDGAVWFNPGNGDVTLIPDFTNSGNKLFGSTANQTSTWIALYDDVIDPGKPNVIHTPGGSPAYHITSGIADGSNPDLLWALTASFSPTGLNANLLNHLSPEVYAGLADYAIQATRTHQRTALSAPALAIIRKPESKSDSKGGCKDASLVKPTGHPWELFAATDYFDVETDNSHNQADYDLSGFGIMVGARTTVADRVRLAAYFAGDDGKVNGPLIYADGSGWSLGILGEILLDEKTHTRFTAGISYGSYTFDGTRGSASATGAGWTPGLVRFDDVDNDALELFMGVEGVIYQNDRFRLMPSANLRCGIGSTDSFTETTGMTPGSPIALAVDRNHYDSALAEFAILAEAAITHDLTLWGQLGASTGLGKNPQAITARFATGSRPMQAEADGLSNDLWFIGLGAKYNINDAISVALGYRIEFRSDSDNQSTVNLSSTFRF
jgi:hypothetical protein